MVSRELRHALSGLGAPAAVLDRDAFDTNLTALRERARGLPIRLATKSLRTPAAIERALSRPGCAGVLAYSLPEALNLHRRGIRDILLGYPSVDRANLRSLLAEAGARANITLMIDSTAHLDIIVEARISLAEASGPDRGAGEGADANVRICFDVDSSYRLGEGMLGDRAHIGARRSPISDAEAAVGLAEEVHARPGVELVGLMFYEGQIAGTADAGRSPRQTVIRAMQKRSIDELAKRRAAVLAAVRDLGELESVNGGGTGSFESSAAEGTLSELAAGSGLFWSSFDNVSGAAGTLGAVGEAFARNRRYRCPCMIPRTRLTGWIPTGSGGAVARCSSRPSALSSNGMTSRSTSMSRRS